VHLISSSPPFIAWIMKVRETSSPRFSIPLVFGRKDTSGILKRGEEVSLTFIIQAMKGGEDEIKCTTIYDGKNISKKLEINVKGPKIKISRSYTIENNKVSLLFKIENYGEAIAYNITVSQPLIKGEKTIFIKNLSPRGSYSEKINFEIGEGKNITLEAFAAKWLDSYGNSYNYQGEPLKIAKTLPERTLKPTKQKIPEEKQGKIFVIISGVLCYVGVILIVFKKVFK